MKVKTLIEIPSARGIIPAGQIIEIPPAVMERLKGKVEPLQGSAHTPKANSTPAVIGEPEAPVCAIWRNPYIQRTPEARQESLLQIMMAITESTFDRVKAIWPMGFLSTPEITAAEVNIEKVQVLVLSGKGRLADYRRAVLAWERICTKEIAPTTIQCERKDILNEQ